MDVICVLFLLCSQLKESSLRAVFDFSASLNDVAPIPPISLSVNLVRTEELIVGECLLCVAILSLHHRSSFVSVVFDINASLNDVAPIAPISFSGLFDENREREKKKEWIVDGFHANVSLVLTSQVKCCECCV